MKEQAITREDSLNVARLEAQLATLELDLAYAERTIQHQNEQIGMQKRLISFYVISSILLLAVIGVIFWFYRLKIKTNKELAFKNQVIMDGINYANTIQNSFLKSREEIQEVFPHFSMIFRPRGCRQR